MSRLEEVGHPKQAKKEEENKRNNEGDGNRTLKTTAWMGPEQEWVDPNPLSPSGEDEEGKFMLVRGWGIYRTCGSW